MKFSNDNVDYSTPETYSATKAWTLSSGDGTKTVYVKFKDNEGFYFGCPPPFLPVYDRVRSDS